MTDTWLEGNDEDFLFPTDNVAEDPNASAMVLGGTSDAVMPATSFPDLLNRPNNELPRTAPVPAPSIGAMVQDLVRERTSFGRRRGRQLLQATANRLTTPANTQRLPSASQHQTANANAAANDFQDSFAEQDPAAAEGDEGELGLDERPAFLGASGAQQRWAPKRRTKMRWTPDDELRFYEALRMFGTKFDMVAVMFPEYSRAEMVSKFHHEQRKNPQRLKEALENSLPVDEEKFADCLKQVQERERANTQNAQRLTEAETRQLLGEDGAPENAEDGAERPPAASPSKASRRPRGKQSAAKTVAKNDADDPDDFKLEDGPQRSTSGLLLASDDGDMPDDSISKYTSEELDDMPIAKRMRLEQRARGEGSPDRNAPAPKGKRTRAKKSTVVAAPAIGVRLPEGSIQGKLQVTAAAPQAPPARMSEARPPKAKAASKANPPQAQPQSKQTVAELAATVAPTFDPGLGDDIGLGDDDFVLDDGLEGAGGGDDGDFGDDALW